MDADIIPLSRFVTSSVKFAHFAVSDLSTEAFPLFPKAISGRLRGGGIWETTSVWLG